MEAGGSIEAEYAIVMSLSLSTDDDDDDEASLPRCTCVCNGMRPSCRHMAPSSDTNLIRGPLLYSNLLVEPVEVKEFLAHLDTGHLHEAFK